MAAPSQNAVDLVKRVIPPASEVTKIPKRAKEDIALMLAPDYSATELIHELCQRLEAAEGQLAVRGGVG